MTQSKLKTDEVEKEIVPVHLELRELRSLGSLMTLDNVAPDQPRGDGGRNWLFIGTVVVPMFLAALYLFFIAADRYQSEVRFIVRSTGGSELAIEGGGGGFGGGSLSRAGEDAFIVDNYIMSRDALNKLVDEKHLKDIIARPEADMFNRFPTFYSSSSRERLFEYYKSMVKTWVDGSTGISTIQVTAFRPQDAQMLARALLGYAEMVVNHINDRANRDRVAYSKQVRDQAKAAVENAENQLTDFRTTSGTVDPTSEYAAALKNIGQLTTEASQREAALSQQVALTPNGPGIVSMREKVKSYRDEIARLNRQLVGGNGSLAVKLARFEQLVLEREIATKELVNAEVSYDTSQREIGQQRLYLQPVVEPNLPDRPNEPKRFLLFAAVVVASGLVYVSLKHFKELAEEHTR